MRRSKLTARWTVRPGRARRFAGALAALFLSSIMLPPVHAMQASAPDAATKAAMDRRTAARTLLSSALARIAANSGDASALRDAGRASIELDDYRAALGFLVRAEQAAPRDGSIKAALGSVMVHMENPTRALDYFGEAQLLGAPERLFLSDRGLARDLLGQQDAAQRDYQLALSMAPSDEITRRYALSLGISGEADRAVQMLTPQLRAQDRGAWRLRAMILAMNGRNGEATEIVKATMPATLAQNILPYLTQMDRLNPAQQAAAAHFGRFPEGNLGPRRKPIQVAAATPAPAPAPATTDRRRGNSDRTRSSATALPAPVQAKRETPPPVQARRVVNAAVPPPAAPPPAAALPAAPLPVATPTAAPTSATPLPGTALASTSLAQTSAATVSPAPAPVAGAPAAPPVLQSSLRPALQPALAASPPVTAPPAAAPAPIATGTSAPVEPGFSIADVGVSAAAKPAFGAGVPTAAPPPADTPAIAAAPSGPPTSSAAAPLASLADIVGSIEIPPEELQAPGNAIGATTLAKLMDDKRRAEAAEAAKREKEAVAAKAKADADAKAEAKAKAEAAEKKANPARLWVQIATGANARALASDYGRFAKKSPDVFKGKSGVTAEWGKTRRLLVGPFKDRKAAQDWLASFKKAGGDGFLFNSEAGQAVDPVK